MADSTTDPRTARSAEPSAEPETPSSEATHDRAQEEAQTSPDTPSLDAVGDQGPMGEPQVPFSASPPQNVERLRAELDRSKTYVAKTAFALVSSGLAGFLLSIGVNADRSFTVVTLAVAAIGIGLLAVSVLGPHAFTMVLAAPHSETILAAEVPALLKATRDREEESRRRAAATPAPPVLRTVPMDLSGIAAALRELRRLVLPAAAEQVKFAPEDVFGLRRALADLERALEEGPLSRARDDTALHLEGVRDHVRARLMSQMSSVEKRASISLLVGIFMGLIGAVMLAWIVFAERPPARQDWAEAMFHFLPRGSLVLVTEAMAFFFLRIFKETAAELRFYHNETSTLDLRCAAAVSGLRLFPDGDVVAALGRLGAVERNFRLGKDESTVELEQLRISGERERELLSLLGSVLGGARSDRTK